MKYKVISEIVDTKNNRALFNKLDKILLGREKGTIFSVLVRLLVEMHLRGAAFDDSTLCTVCANTKLTEILQAIRTMNDEIIKNYPKDDLVEHDTSH